MVLAMILAAVESSGITAIMVHGECFFFPVYEFPLATQRRALRITALTDPLEPGGILNSLDIHAAVLPS